MRETTYGKKGGTGPTSGKRATAYVVTLPDGSAVTKRIFHPVETPTGYAYQHDGKWHLSTVADADAGHLQHYTKCPARAA